MTPLAMPISIDTTVHARYKGYGDLYAHAHDSSFLTPLAMSILLSI